jgi:hypothetical protein
MGLELILGAVSAIVGIFGAIGQADAANRSAAAQAQAAAEQKESNQIQAAGTENTSSESRRQRVREGRIRRAQIIAASENAGTGQSSGQVGAVGALSTNLSGLLGSSLGEAAANRGINASNQRSADFMGVARQAEADGAVLGAWTGAIQSGISGFSSIFDKKS